MVMRGAYPANAYTQVHERIYGIHFRTRQSRVLVQPPAILVRDTFSVLDV